MSISFAVLNLNAEDFAVILGIIGMILGSKKMPGLSKNVGQSLKSFRDGINEATELKRELKDQVTETKQAVLGVNGEQPPAPTKREPAA